MKNILTLFFFLNCLIGICQNWHVTTPISVPMVDNPTYKPGYTYLADESDEFNSLILDGIKWDLREGSIGSCDPSGEGSYVLEENAELTGSSIILKCVETNDYLQDPDPGCTSPKFYDYTGAWLMHNTIFGPGMYYEVRVKRNNLGSKSSFWFYDYTTNKDFSVFDNDFKEVSNLRQINVNFSDEINNYDFYIDLDTSMPEQYNDYYTYGVEWDINEIKIYLNNHLIAVHNSSIIPPGNMSLWFSPLYWHEPSYRAEGEFEIDYFRVYEKNCDVGTSTSNYTYSLGYSSQEERPRLTGDFNGDNITDIVAFGTNFTRYSYGQSSGVFSTSQIAFYDYTVEQNYNNQNLKPRIVGDVNGDGRDDIVAFGSTWTSVRLGLASGGFSSKTNIFQDFTIGQGWSSQDTKPRFLADVNGDGRMDIVGFSDTYVRIALGQASGTFGTPFNSINNFTVGQNYTSQETHPRFLSDVNGDGRTDIIGFGPSSVNVSLGNSNGTFGTAQSVISDYSVSQGWNTQSERPRLVSDVNGDGKADIVGFGYLSISISLASTSGNFNAKTVIFDQFTKEQGWTSLNDFPRKIVDVNGDCKADIIGFGEGEVKISISNCTSSSVSFEEYQNVVDDFCVSEGWSNQNTYPRFICDIDGDYNNDIIGFGHSDVLALTCLNSTINSCQSASINIGKALVTDPTVDESDEIRIFPNPASSMVNLKSSTLGSLEVFNSIGEIVYMDSNISNEKIIDVTNFTSGIYLFRFNTESGNPIIRKVVIE